MHETETISPLTLAPCAYCGCEKTQHQKDGSCRNSWLHNVGHGKGPCVKPQSCYGYVPEPDDSETSEYREGFIDGYLRAHEDGDEYQCSVRMAKIGYEKYKADGGRALPRQNVEGW